MELNDLYKRAISSFAADFSLILEGEKKLSDLEHLIDNKDPRLLSDIDLLCNLDFNLRHNLVDLIEVK